MKVIVEISEERRKKLGSYIEKIKNDRNLGFNQLAIKSKVNVRALNEILYGKSKKANPFYLQRIAEALKIDYKELYRIVGYLSEDDFEKGGLLKQISSNEENEGRQIGNYNIDSKMINVSDLTNKEIGHIESYIEFMRFKKKKIDKKKGL